MTAHDLMESLPRARLATLPTPLEPGGDLAGGGRLFVKRDDLTGLGMGGNKARKLEYLCADARARRCDRLVTIGAGQSNHVRMTAAAGSVLGIETHVVVGETSAADLEGPTGNLLLTKLFGATIHPRSTSSWAELDAHMRELARGWEREGHTPYVIPMGGSTATGIAGFARAWFELLDQCDEAGIQPAAVIHASSTGGTHGGLLAGRALRPGPDIHAIGVAKTSDELGATARGLANELLARWNADADVPSTGVNVHDDFAGVGYGQPTKQGDEAIRWAARRGGWVLDRTYTGKALSGLLDLESQGELPAGDVIFWHTGGHPAVFSHGGVPGSTEAPVREAMA